MEHLTAAEGEQLARQPRRAVCRLVDELDVAAVRAIGGEALREKGAASADDRQQVVEVVGDASREPSDGFHLLGLAELSLPVVQSARGRLPLGAGPVLGPGGGGRWGGGGG